MAAVVSVRTIQAARKAIADELVVREGLLAVQAALEVYEQAALELQNLEQLKQVLDHDIQQAHEALAAVEDACAEAEVEAKAQAAAHAKVLGEQAQAIARNEEVAYGTMRLLQEEIAALEGQLAERQDAAVRQIEQAVAERQAVLERDIKVLEHEQERLEALIEGLLIQEENLLMRVANMQQRYLRAQAEFAVQEH